MPVVGRARRQHVPRTRLRQACRTETAGTWFLRRVELPDAVDICDKRRIGAERERSSQVLMGEELTQGAPDHRFALAGDVPSNAQARREIVVVLQAERAVGSRCATGETRLPAPIGS